MNLKLNLSMILLVVIAVQSAPPEDSTRSPTHLRPGTGFSSMASSLRSSTNSFKNKFSDSMDGLMKRKTEEKSNEIELMSYKMKIKEEIGQFRTSDEEKKILTEFMHNFHVKIEKHGKSLSDLRQLFREYFETILLLDDNKAISQDVFASAPKLEGPKHATPEASKGKARSTHPEHDASGGSEPISTDETKPKSIADRIFVAATKFDHTNENRISNILGNGLIIRLFAFCDYYSIDDSILSQDAYKFESGLRFLLFVLIDRRELQISEIDSLMGYLKKMIHREHKLREDTLRLFATVAFEGNIADPGEGNKFIESQRLTREDIINLNDTLDFIIKRVNDLPLNGNKPELLRLLQKAIVLLLRKGQIRVSFAKISGRHLSKEKNKKDFLREMYQKLAYISSAPVLKKIKADDTVEELSLYNTKRMGLSVLMDSKAYVETLNIDRSMFQSINYFDMMDMGNVLDESKVGEREQLEDKKKGKKSQLDELRDIERDLGSH